MKEKLQKRFKELYKGKRLLAVQLNGFSHKVFYDNGSSTSQVTIEEFSNYMTVGEHTRGEYQTLKKLFDGIPHFSYKHDPKEIIYILPNDR
jgi:hypothetical protein